jgi:hypothetical protein
MMPDVPRFLILHTTRERESDMTRFLSSVLGLLALGFVTTVALADDKKADATGTWKWSVERNGQTFETTLKLKQDGDKLTGTITGRQGNETAIEEGKVKDGEVTFKVVREFNGNKITFDYKGKLDGDMIKGKTEFEREGEKMSRDWEAKRS